MDRLLRLLNLNQMKFEKRNYSTSELLGKPVNCMDLGSITKGMFTKYKRVKIESLFPRQTYVEGETLNLKLSGKYFTVPCVAISPSGNILIDGHHTVIAKKLRGQKYVNAMCYIFNPLIK